MDHYAFARDFRKVYDAAVARFAAGQRDAATLLTDEERKFVSANGRIQSRKRTGFSGQNQRQLALAIKQARMIGLMPFVGRI